MPCFNRKLSWVLLAMVALTIDVAQSLATNTEQIEVQAEDGNQTVEGVVLVEAIDGGNGGRGAQAHPTSFNRVTHDD